MDFFSLIHSKNMRAVLHPQSQGIVKASVQSVTEAIKTIVTVVKN